MALANTEEIIENSVFLAIQNNLIAEGYLPDLSPFDFENPDPAIAEQANDDYRAALQVIRNQKGFSIEVFNYDNAQSRGIKTVPRIVLETQGFYPGSIGKDSTAQYKLNEGGTYDKEFDGQKTSDLYFNIYLVANDVKQIRVLHAINSLSLPRLGYIPRFESLDDELMIKKNGNIFIEYINYNEQSDTDRGVIEKVYRYAAVDVVERLATRDNTDISKIISIEKEVKVE